VPELPEGVVTFVFTDVEGSTRLWEDAPDSMMQALDQHDEVIESVIAEHNGISVKPRGEGDSRFLVFGTAADALAAIAEVQVRLAATDWVTPRPIRVRASIHTGTAGVQLGDYYGSAVNRAARLRGIAHGGQTVMSRSAWELVQDQVPDGVTIRDMGEHGLKDLTRPEHVYQINVDGMPDDFPPLKSLATVPNNLPQQLTEFVGRDRELADAARLLGQARLLTIIAPGGAGKTRLGIQVAAELVDDFPDGVFFIALADISSSGDIVQAIAESVGVALSSDEDTQTQLLTYLSNKQQLLVFDNFEHVATGAAIISEILKAAPAVKVVATSRSKLNLTGETVLALSGLVGTWATPDEALKTSGVQLFLDAANRANPAFSLEEADLEPLAEILRLTGGLPLGILLAAAWVDMLPVVEIAAEVAKSLDFLETEMGDVPDRHRSIRAVFDYSWALLSEAEREMFAALSVFKGGFTREAAQVVAGASLRNLATLSNKSLVTPSPDTGRYAIHEMLRNYAQGELQRDQESCNQALDAHAAFYGDLTEKATELIFASDQPKMRAVIESDIENIRSAWRHYLSTENAAGALRLLPGVALVYEWRGWYPAGVALFGEAAPALAGAPDGDDVVTLRRMAKAVQGWFLSLLGQPDVGAAAAAEATESLPASADRIHRWTALQCRAIGMVYLGQTDELAGILDRAIDEYQSMPDPYWSAGLKNWRAFAAFMGGDLETARRLIPEAMAVFEPRNEHYYTIWNLWLQAMGATLDGRPTDAIGLYARQVARSEELGYLRGKVVAFEGLGDANLAADRMEAAEIAFVQGIEVAEQMGMVVDMLGMMTKVGTARAAMARETEAVELLAAVCAEPASLRQTFTANLPIRDMATAALAEIQGRLAGDDYSAAYARGTAKPYEVAAKELMDGLAR
jgi:predicted ATPase/class 3 adenylate cyclase